jgi:CheY-like chemotaxis protein
MSQKLLVIDDSITVRKMAELSFRNEGWSVDFATSGAEGVTKALATQPDLVLLDFVLPDMKATDVCERLAASPRSNGLAIILMSAKMDRVRELFRPYPMVVDFVGKPFAANDILERAARAQAARRGREPAQTKIASVPTTPVVHAVARSATPLPVPAPAPGSTPPPAPPPVPSSAFPTTVVRAPVPMPVPAPRPAPVAAVATASRPVPAVVAGAPARLPSAPSAPARLPSAPSAPARLPSAPSAPARLPSAPSAPVRVATAPAVSAPIPRAAVAAAPAPAPMPTAAPAPAAAAAALAEPAEPPVGPGVTQPMSAVPHTPVFSFKQREAAALAMFHRMKRALAWIPEWNSKLEGHAPAPYFARKLLTPEVVDGVLEALLPLVREVVGTEGGHGPGPGGAEPPALAGQVSSFPLRDLLRLLALGTRTGELIINHDGQTALIYWLAGEILAATSHDANDYAHGAPPLEGLPAAELERAAAEQRGTGVPIYVTLDQRGLLAGHDVPALLEAQGRRVLSAAESAASLSFTWRDRETLPAWVEAYGQHLEIVAAVSPEQTLAQLTLERLRRPSSWRAAQLHLPGSGAVYVRAAGFSARLLPLRLTANEQRVLTLVDGKNTLNTVAQRSGIPAQEVARILYRLAAIELVEAVATVRSSSLRQRRSALRPVMILEPDHEGFHTPLRALLANRAEPLELVDLAGESDLLGAIERERPALVILNASTTDLGDVARAIRATPGLANVSLAAILESQLKSKMDELAAAGFDAVLVKPVLYSDLSKLIASSFLAANSASAARPTENHGEDPRR